ncbi:hypothetical protein CYMTET_31267 [Cymbomonas tetramitiformis]|uniref:Uncharacterized protein n=1 Tax=Cymbomonas tetramitiformis TaxID=36881 RepID=A0AAE0FHG2_9CHLO|nr:hypothetical protein CYMTET_31267 [Cymbomonas tetramitiformis]
MKSVLDRFRNVLQRGEWRCDLPHEEPSWQQSQATREPLLPNRQLNQVPEEEDPNVRDAYAELQEAIHVDATSLQHLFIKCKKEYYQNNKHGHLGKREYGILKHLPAVKELYTSHATETKKLSSKLYHDWLAWKTECIPTDRRIYQGEEKKILYTIWELPEKQSEGYSLKNYPRQPLTLTEAVTLLKFAREKHNEHTHQEKLPDDAYDALRNLILKSEKSHICSSWYCADYDHALYSTLFMIGELFGWLEVIRREVVFLSGSRDADALSVLIDDLKFHFSGETCIHGKYNTGRESGAAHCFTFLSNFSAMEQGTLCRAAVARSSHLPSLLGATPQSEKHPAEGSLQAAARAGTAFLSSKHSGGYGAATRAHARGDVAGEDRTLEDFVARVFGLEGLQ